MQLIDVIDVIDLLYYLSYFKVVKDYLVRDNFKDENDIEVEITVKNTVTLKLNDAYWYLTGLVDAQDLD